MTRIALATVLLALAGCEASDAALGDPEGTGEPAAFDDPAGPVTLALAGDAMLGRGIDAIAGSDPSFEFFRDLAPRLTDVDFFGVNLETTITTETEEWPGKNYHFKVHPDNAPILLGQLPIPAETRRVLSLANNHILDFFEPGLFDTIANLDAIGIPHAGAGATLAEAKAPEIVTTASGVRIGILSASSHCSCSPTWRAAEAMPGMWQFDGPSRDWDELLSAVSELRREVDWVVVTLHWGPNWVDAWPIDWMPELGAALVEAGASVVHGHSAHHVLPIDRVDGVPVLYGSGDFLDDYGPREGYRDDLGYLARVRLVPGMDAELEIIPLRIEHGEGHWVHPLDPSDPDFDLVMSSAGF